MNHWKKATDALVVWMRRRVSLPTVLDFLGKIDPNQIGGSTPVD